MSRLKGFQLVTLVFFVASRGFSGEIKVYDYKDVTIVSAEVKGKLDRIEAKIRNGNQAALKTDEIEELIVDAKTLILLAISDYEQQWRGLLRIYNTEGNGDVKKIIKILWIKGLETKESHQSLMVAAQIRALNFEFSKDLYDSAKELVMKSDDQKIISALSIVISKNGTKLDLELLKKKLLSTTDQDTRSRLVNAINRHGHWNKNEDEILKPNGVPHNGD